MSMFRMKSVLTVLVLAVIVGVVPMAFGAAASKVVIAGSSALWQTMALGAYNGTTASVANGGGGCPNATTYVPPCFHWTSGSNKLSLVDARVSPTNVDAATVWVVWDSNTTTSNGVPDIWVFAKVDSVVGDRCFFANPACQVTDTLNPTTNADWNTGGSNQITVAAPGWGASGDTGLNSGTTLANEVLAFVEAPANMAINVAATDIRPEDAWWAVGRVNSALGTSTAGTGFSDGTDGLGYNSNNAAGTVPNYVTATTGTCSALAQKNAVGTPIYSAFQTTSTSSDAANVLAFSILGKDPITCSVIGTYSVASVGAAPIVFVASRISELSGLQNASEQQLQQVFSGLNTDASAFGLGANPINAFLREPLSGTMNTTEATVFRLPTLYSTGTAAAAVEGNSQELCTGTPTAGSTSNPLNLASSGLTCANGSTGGGGGSRFRAIGTGEEVNSVQCSNNSGGSKCGGNFTNASHHDGIGYTFFSYGNVKVLADSTSYGYITLNGIDPVFLSYQGGIDPGQPNPATYGGLHGIIPQSEVSFPACENAIWKYTLSFPNVRNGQYRAWSVLRLVYGTAAATTVTNLVKSSNTYVVTTVPDYIPFAKQTITAPSTCSASASFVDPGFLLVRSHYLQRDGANKPLGNNKAIANITSENGGDMGGAILINSTNNYGVLDTTTQLISSDNANNLSPAVRPNP
jgi:hypothetical protein